MYPHLLPMLMGVAPSAFSGGRNTPHMYGVSPLDGGVVKDFDLKAAYLTVMRMMWMPKWSTTRATLDLDELAVVDEALVVASVNFKFPPGTRHPCLTERCGNYGLLYPMSWSGVRDRG